MRWTFKNLLAVELTGLLPDIFRSEDPRPAAEQANDRYAHGGGWRPQAKWKISPVTGVASYPGDPDMEPIALGRLRNERVYVYDHGYVCIMQTDGTFEMCRMD
jgi:hypothetical protein